MQLKIYLGVSEVNIKLDKPYDYYYKLLFNQGVRLFKTVEMNDNEKEYIFTRYNKEFKIKLKEIKNVGLVVSYVDYHNYNLTKEEQKRFIDMDVFDRIKGNDKTRVEWLNTIYESFLSALGYEWTGWRETEEEIPRF